MIHRGEREREREREGGGGGGGGGGGKGTVEKFRMVLYKKRIMTHQNNNNIYLYYLVLHTLLFVCARVPPSTGSLQRRLFSNISLNMEWVPDPRR